MSEILSQEQIDSLLKQKDFGAAEVSGAEPSGGPDGFAASKDYDALRGVFELFSEQAGETISTIFNKKAVFEVMHCAQIETEKARENLTPPLLLLTIPFKTGFDGALWCILTQKDVAHFSDLMMMGDGNAPFTNDHKDAVAELFSQICGGYATALGKKIGVQVGVDRISVSEFDFNSPSVPLDASDLIVVQGTIADSDVWRMHFLVPSDLGAHMASAWNKGGQSDAAVAFDGASAQDGIFSTPGSVTRDSFVETSLSGDSMRSSAPRENIDMLLDVELDIYIELGRTNLSIKRILDLSPGSIVELDRMAGEPVDLLVNEKVIAKGEVVVLDENFGIRIVSLVSAEDRIKSLK